MSFDMVRRQAKTRRRVRSYCSTCKRPIFEGEQATWLTSPMGLSHAECVEEES